MPWRRAPPSSPPRSRWRASPPEARAHVGHCRAQPRRSLEPSWPCSTIRREPRSGLTQRGHRCRACRPRRCRSASKRGGARSPAMRVLWVTPSLPHPLGTGGCVLEFEMIRALAARHEIHVVTSDVRGFADRRARPGGRCVVLAGDVVPRSVPDGSLREDGAMAVARPDLLTWLKRERLDALAAAMRRIDADRPGRRGR